MSWTVASVLARASDSLAARQRWLSAYAVSHAHGLAQRGTRPQADSVPARVFRYRQSLLSPADRKALDSALAHLGDHGSVIERAVASGAPVAAAAQLAQAWDRLAPPVQAVLIDPLGRDNPCPVSWGSVRAVQVDATTCGAASATLMNAMADPLVALWIMTGRTMGDYVPACVGMVSRDANTSTVEQRWQSLQRGVHAQASSAFPPWPRMWGTSPWGLITALRVWRIKWRVAWLRAADPREVTAMVAHLRAALRDGVPVAAYVSGDINRGMAAVVPRHVVAVVRAVDDGFLVYEPGSGALHRLDPAQMISSGQAIPAWGGWSVLNALVLPSARRRA